MGGQVGCSGTLLVPNRSLLHHAMTFKGVGKAYLNSLSALSYLTSAMTPLNACRDHFNLSLTF